MHNKTKKLMAGIMAAAMVTTASAAAASPAANAEKRIVQVLGESTFEKKAVPWQTVEAWPARQKFNIEDGAFHIYVLVPEGADKEKWDLQVKHRNLSFRAGHEYKVSFKAKASRKGMELCSYIGNIAGTQEYFVLDGRDVDEGEGGMHMGPDMGGSWPSKCLNLTTEWQTCEGIFKATEDLEACQWTFQYAKGTNYQGNAKEGDEIWFDDMSIECLTCEEEGLDQCGWNNSNDLGIVDPKSDVRLNQMGYYPDREKKAVYVTGKDRKAMDFKVLDKDGKTVFSGKTVPAGFDELSGEYCHYIDFSAVKTKGTYTIAVDDEKNIFTNEITGETCKRYISHEFRIGDDIYDGVLKNALNYYYMNRANCKIEPDYINSEDKHALAHNPLERKDNAYVQSAWSDTYIDTRYDADYKLNKNVLLDVSGGWYDSEHFTKDVVNGGTAVWTLQNMYERSKIKGTDGKWADGKTMTIPEEYGWNGGKTVSCKGTPDILDEARYELEFMFRMIVDPEKDTIWGEDCAGLVYHQVKENSNYNTYELPFDEIDHEKNPRVISPPSYAATFNMIACAAQASRLWKGIDDDFAKECLDHAEKSWEAVLKHEEKFSAEEGDNDEDPQFTPYQRQTDLDATNSNVMDEAYWAACELFATTGEKAYYDYLKKYKGTSFESRETQCHALGVPNYIPLDDSYGSLSTLDRFNKTGCGTLSLFLSDKTSEADKAEIKKSLLYTADMYLDRMNDTENNAMGMPYQKVQWLSYYSYPSDAYTAGLDYGSNSRVTGNAAVMAYAYDATGDSKYLSGALQSIDYLFGRNGLGFSYVTGCGSYHVKNPVNEYWLNEVSKNYPKAPDGVMVGGPYTWVVDNYARAIGLDPDKTAPQKCYADSVEAWSENAPDVDWQAGFAWNISFIEDVLAAEPVSVTTTTTTGTATTTTTTATSTTTKGKDDTTTSTTTLTTVIVPEPFEYGDANCDGKVDMGDVVLIMQALANPDKYGVGGTDKNAFRVQGWNNADVYDKGSGVTTNDALAIQEFLLGKVKELPVAAAK